MNKANVRLVVDIELGSNYHDYTKEELECIAYDLITECLSIRKEEQYSDEDRFDSTYGFVMGDYRVNVLEDN